MGLFTINPPKWHPAPPGLIGAVSRAAEATQDWPGGLPNVAIGFALRQQSDNGTTMQGNEDGLDRGDIPTVVGLSTPEEVHESVRIWREVRAGSVNPSRLHIEEKVFEELQASGYLGWAWESPPPPNASNMNGATTHTNGHDEL